MTVLVVNAGGVTLELALVDATGATLADRLVDPWDGDTSEISKVAVDYPDIEAVGHRVVHGGELNEPVIIDDHVRRAIADAAQFSPLHQQRALLGIAAAQTALPDAPHVACFDTTFHRTMPDAAATYALPEAWRDRWPLRRVGFHGLSHQHVATVAGGLVPNRPANRVVSCHLGSGASLCAIADGRSIDTTMGPTPMEGLVMVSRSGTVDPGALLWLLRNSGLSVDEIDDALNRHSGLRGLAGGSGDMRDVVHRANAHDLAAQLAFDVYIHRLRREIGAMTASLGGLDVLAFTGGVGQHMPAVRAAAVASLEHLGLGIDRNRNESAVDDADISAPLAPAACVVIATGEHLTIAAATRTATQRQS
jgi:acetate kinase